MAKPNKDLDQTLGKVTSQKVFNDKIILSVNDKINIVIDEISSDQDDWVVIKDEKYRPDKESFIIKKFKESFPNITLPEIGAADRIYKLASRAQAITEWLALQNLDYSLIENSPTYYRDSIPADDFNKAQEVLTKISYINSARAAEELELVKEYKNKMEAIKNKWNNKEKALLDNDYVKILNINSQQLPLSLQNAIENYTAASNAPDRKTYAREILIKFQVALIKALKECKEKGIDFNFEQILEDLSVK